MDSKTFDGLWGQFKQLHRKEELWQLVNLVEWFKPKAILELGVCHGGSFKMWEAVIPDDGLLIGVDRLNVVQWNWRKSPKNVFYVQGNLDEGLTYKRVVECLGGTSADFLYIDADHFYEAFKRHLDLYSTLVRDGGLIAFHDIRDNKGSGYGVGRYFEELKERHDWMEILVPLVEGIPGADGIGIIFK
jgi:predicted O-methyltransferase YrrM